MRKVSKVLALVLAIAMVFGLAACGTPANNTPANNGNTEPAPAERKEVDSYSLLYAFNVTTLDYLYDNHSTNGDFTANFTEGLLTQDNHGVLVPGMATEWSSNQDASEWYFTIRDDATWSTASGEVYAKVTAEDFVTGLKHAADSKSLVLGLVKDMIKGLAEYADGTGKWEDVGIKAEGNKLTYTLNTGIGYFDGLTTYNILRPLNAEFLAAQGDKFGAVDPASILYNGCYILSSVVAGQEVKFDANPNYYDKDNVHVKHVTVTYTDGKDPMQNYNMFKNGEVTTTAIQLGQPEMVADAEKNYKDNMFKGMTTSTSFWGAFNWDRQAYALFSDTTKSTTAKTTDQQKADTKAAILNKNFRLGVYAGYSEKAYYEVALGEIAEDRARNTLTPYTFSALSTGESFGSLVTKYIEQVNPDLKGINLNDGQDAWYNPERAKMFMEKAKAELGDSVKEWPVHLDVVEDGTDEMGKNMALAMQKSIEDAVGDYVKIDLIFMDNPEQVNDAFFNNTVGEDNSMDVAFSAGWGPDYGDPYTYIHCFDPDDGDMLLYSGITPKTLLEPGTERLASQEAALKAIGLTDIKALMDEANAATGDERIDKFAQVEAFLLGNGILRPFATRGAGLGVSKVKPFSAGYGLYGQASTNIVPYFKYMVVYDQPITADEYNAAKEAWLAGK
jgi:oligopeptide transport system substrate-binding protein